MTDTRAETLVPPPSDPVTDAVEASGIVAVVRTSTAAHILPITDALVQAGITTIEITLTTPGAIIAITKLRETQPPSILIGAGSVMTASQAGECADAGADFVVAPNFDRAVVQAAQERGITTYPGVLTPSEAVAAIASGVPAVKLFPASTVGTEYLAALRAPLPDLLAIPSGGIRIEDVEQWIRAGAIAVGVGGPLIGDAAESGPDERMVERARRALEAVRAGRHHK